MYDTDEKRGRREQMTIDGVVDNCRCGGKEHREKRNYLLNFSREEKLLNNMQR